MEAMVEVTSLWTPFKTGDERLVVLTPPQITLYMVAKRFSHPKQPEQET